MKPLLQLLILCFALTSFVLTADADCEKVDNTTATKPICNGIVVDDKMKFCCFITYREKATNTQRTRCKLLENTRFALSWYEDTFDNVSGFKIQCSSGRNRLLVSVVLILGILLV